MARQKFTVFLLPDGDGYQVCFPHYPNCITWGKTVTEALTNAKEAIEMVLDYEAEIGWDPVPPNVHVDHVVIGEIEAEIPDSMSILKYKLPIPRTS